MTKNVFLTIVVSVITSLAVSGIALYFYLPTLPVFQKQINGMNSSVSANIYPTSSVADSHFSEYETIINDFLGKIRKGDIEQAYSNTSPVFQKKTSLDSFKTLVKDYNSSKNIPSTYCSLKQYSEPFSSTIEGLPGDYMIVQTTCEAIEDNGIKGFNFEFIKDQGISKISYVKVYKNPVIHKRQEP